jgi:hypothetical protein
MRALLLTLLVAAPAWAREGIRGGDQAWREGRFELGPRLTHLTLVDAETEASLPMGGVGLYSRYRITRRFGAEGALDVLMSDEFGQARPGEVVRLSTPFAFSGMFYFFPDDRFQLYLLLGFGVAGHEVRYEALGQSVHSQTPMVVSGLGGQYRAESIRFDFSLRSLTLREEGRQEVEQIGAPKDPRVGYRPRLDARDLQGGMFTLGVHWGW